MSVVVNSGANQPVAVPDSGAATQPIVQPEANAPWTVGNPDYDKVIQSKGWKGPQDALKSYTELESQYGKITPEHKKLMDFYQSMLPHLDSFDAYLMAKDAKDKGDAKEPSETDKALKELKERQDNEFDERDRRDRKFARNTAIKQYQAEFSDHESIEAEVSEIVRSKRIAVNDPTDPDEILEMLRSARKIVIANRSEAAERGRRASSLEGGSTDGQSQLSGNGLTLDQIREKISQ